MQSPTDGQLVGSNTQNKLLVVPFHDTLVEVPGCLFSGTDARCFLFAFVVLIGLVEAKISLALDDRQRRLTHP